MDDESYFTLDGTNSQPKHFYSSNGTNISKTSEFLQKGKFPSKLMVWMVISEKNFSEPKI